MQHQELLALALAISTSALLACSNSPAQPTTPSETTAVNEHAAPDGSTLKVTAPTPAMPTEGTVVEDNRPQLEVDNAQPRFGDGLPLSYVFQVYDAQEQLVYESGPIEAGPHGRTWHVLTSPLNFDTTYKWRAYATYDGHRGPMSATTTFRTFDRYGRSCAPLRNELAIVQCRRAQFGHMSPADRVEFLHRIAHDLNRASAVFAPYGLLLKSSGNNCYGYACDIICSNTGGVHRQWDVLSDEDRSQTPLWGQVGDVAPRGCEIAP
jgi:hypothetical protein